MMKRCAVTLIGVSDFISDSVFIFHADVVGASLMRGIKGGVFMRMGSPAMRKMLQRAESGEIAPKIERASYGGIAIKSVVYAVATILSAVAVILLLQYAINIGSENMIILLVAGSLGCAIPMLIISFVVMFSPKTVKVLGVVYCILQGALLGVVVYFVDSFFPGIALAAVLGTIIVFVTSVVMRRFFEVRISSRFLRGFLVGFISFIALEFVLFIVSLFVPSLEVLFTVHLALQLLISAFCVIYATVMLLWDLQMAQNIVSAGADKTYEWQVAFSLITTLVYMYLEILELLLRIVMLLSRSRN